MRKCETRDGRTLVLHRITIPEKEQAALLVQLGWTLPEQPPPRIRANQLPDQNWTAPAIRHGRHRKCVADFRANKLKSP